MAKLTLSDLVNLQNESTAVATLNANWLLIEAALENTLSRDGTSPNEMEADLDMNDNRILNLPAPVQDTEPLRLMDLASFDQVSADLISILATDFVVKTATGTLSAERVLTDNTAITFDWSVAGQVKPVRAALTGDVTAASNSNTTTVANCELSALDITGATADASPARGADYIPTYDASATANRKVLISDLLFHFEPQGRLTLTTATPVTTSDVTAATTIYYTPYKGNFVPLYDGTRFVPTAFTELSQTTTDTTKSPAAVANSSVYDLFVWSDSGTVRCTRGPAWSSDTARSSGLTLTNGIYLNTSTITNGPAALRGTYVGTVRSNGSAQIVDSLATRWCWNMYNRVDRAMEVKEATNTWTYSTATWRQANASTANQLDMVRGVNEDAIMVTVIGTATNSDATLTNARIGIGIDSTTAFSGVASAAPVSSTAFFPLVASYVGFPGLGRHYAAWLEYSDAGGGDVMTWYGDNNVPLTFQSGMTGLVRA